MAGMFGKQACSLTKHCIIEREGSEREGGQDHQEREDLHGGCGQPAGDGPLDEDGCVERCGEARIKKSRLSYERIPTNGNRSLCSSSKFA